MHFSWKRLGISALLVKASAALALPPGQIEALNLTGITSETLGVDLGTLTQQQLQSRLQDKAFELAVGGDAKLTTLRYSANGVIVEPFTDRQTALSPIQYTATISFLEVDGTSMMSVTKKTTLADGANLNWQELWTSDTPELTASAWIWRRDGTYHDLPLDSISFVGGGTAGEACLGCPAWTKSPLSGSDGGLLFSSYVRPMTSSETQAWSAQFHGAIEPEPGALTIMVVGVMGISLVIGRERPGHAG